VRLREAEIEAVPLQRTGLALAGARLVQEQEELPEGSALVLDPGEHRRRVLARHRVRWRFLGPPLAGLAQVLAEL
jgi:hypothetical protein